MGITHIILPYFGALVNKKTLVAEKLNGILTSHFAAVTITFAQILRTGARRREKFLKKTGVCGIIIIGRRQANNTAAPRKFGQ